MKKLNGWQRIGIVLSIVWFIGFAAFVWVSERQRIGDFYERQLGLCKAILDMDNENVAANDPRWTVNWADYDKCNDHARELFYSSHEDTRKRVPMLLAVDLGMIALGWLAVWLAVVVVRWIRRGFA
jgi:hypothetical protein